MLLHSPVLPKTALPKEPPYLSPINWYDIPDYTKAMRFRERNPDNAELFSDRLQFWYCRLYAEWDGEIGDAFDAEIVDFKPPIGVKTLYFCKDTAKPDLVKVQGLIKCYKPQPLQGVLVKYKPAYESVDGPIEYKVEWFVV